MYKIIKKAQTSIFIIIGVILVISIIAAISFNSNKLTIFSDQKSSLQVEEFVDSCIQLETDRAMELVASKGGWIYPPQEILYYAKVNLRSNDETTFQDFLIQDSQGLQDPAKEKIPYWFYYDDGDEAFKTQIPPYPSTDNRNNPHSIDNQMERYIKENIESECFRGFSPFLDAYEINYDLEDLVVDVEFTNDEIRTFVEMPIEVLELSTQSTEYISEFDYKTPNKIYIPYNLIKDIVYTQSESSFIEHRIIDFIYANQDTNSRDNLPPFSEYTLDYDFKPWRVDLVENRVRQIIESKTYLIKDINTKNEELEIPKGLEDSPFANAVLNEIYSKDYLSQNSQLLTEGNERLFSEFSNVELDFEYYSFYPMHLRIDPSFGNVIAMPRPQSFLGLIPIFMTEYTFAYEITTPINIIIAHEDYPNYQFRVPIEINIDHNSPLRENYDFGFDPDLFEEPQTSITNQLTCDPAQFISKPIRLNITDQIAHGTRSNLDDPKVGVDDAFVQFKCGFEICPVIGETKTTKLVNGDEKTILEFSLPINCPDGKLEIVKFGYESLELPVSPSLRNEVVFGEQNMSSAKTMRLKIRKKDPLTGINGGNPQTLKGNEEGFIIFKHNVEENFVSVVEFNTENQFDDLTVDLIPGNYSIIGFTIDEFDTINIDIPKSNEDIELTSWITSSLENDGVEIDLFDLMRHDTVLVNLVKTNTPYTLAQLESLSDTLSNIKEYSNSGEFDPIFYNE